MKIIRKRLGPNHPLYNHTFPGFTQVLVIRVDNDGKSSTLAQFYGTHAKMLSMDFILSRWAGVKVQEE